MISGLCKSFQKISIQKGFGYSNSLNYTSTNNIAAAQLFEKSFEFPIINFKSKENSGSIQLSKDVFSVPLRVDLLHRMVRYQRAKTQQGTHQALNMARMDKTNKKPTKQKGSGNARKGTNHSVHFRGGARTFAPFMRSHAHDLPNKVRKLCLKVALSTKLAQNKLIIVDEFNLESHKTKELVSNLPKEWGRSLLVDSEISDFLGKSSLNVQKIDALPQLGLNVYTILQNDTLVLSKSSVEALQARLSQSE
ncbi:hypothetical protein RB653_001600 [Dictyostelium firmibasis]|uniref:Large ribosomal subunit protein uL4m n=1 Tax=Dictyostelium firmibasis TaxID=79012 RepID=A0AAN7TXA0_9MYCE